MKTLRLPLLVIAFTAASPAFAADAVAPPTWRAETLGQALLYVLMFAAVGIVIAIVGYKLFDKFTPGDLHKEIVEKQNVAAAIVAAAVVIGVSIIIAAAMIG